MVKLMLDSNGKRIETKNKKQNLMPALPPNVVKVPDGRCYYVKTDQLLVLLPKNSRRPSQVCIKGGKNFTFMQEARPIW